MDLIRKLEQGRRHTVSIGNLHRIARALDVDAGDLLGKTQPLPDPGEHFGAVAIRRALTQVDDLIGDEPDVEPLTLDDARRALTYGWGAYWAGRYDRLGHLLPGAIGRLRATVRRPAPTTAPAPTTSPPRSTSSPPAPWCTSATPTWPTSRSARH